MRHAERTDTPHWAETARLGREVGFTLWITLVAVGVGAGVLAGALLWMK